jgi:hypothetical protein
VALMMIVSVSDATTAFAESIYSRMVGRVLRIIISFFFNIILVLLAI